MPMPDPDEAVAGPERAAGDRAAAFASGNRPAPDIQPDAQPASQYSRPNTAGQTGY
jgi:hypothetical protein